MKAQWLAASTVALATVALATAGTMSAQTWRQVGPPGGTVITLEADPHDLKKIYLGTSDGHVFSSADEGAHWQLLSRIGTGQDDVVTHILVDSRDSNRLYASTWTLYSGGGGVYRSGYDPRIRSAFSGARAFVTPYAASGLDEYFAECVRAFCGANVPSSPWPAATPDRLRKLDPTMFAITGELFAEAERRALHR